MISEFPRPGHFTKTEHRRAARPYADRVYAWLVSEALRYLLLVGQRVGLKLPDAADLAEVLEVRAHESGGDRIKSHYDVQRSRAGRRDGWITDLQLSEMCVRAASFALDAYRPGYLESARKGGRNSKRPPTYTVDQLAALDGLSIAQQAEALGCAPATVSRLRKQVRERASVNPLQDFEDLIASL